MKGIAWMMPAPTGGSVSAVMRDVLVALVPGMCIAVWMLGPGVLLQVALATLVAMTIELLCESVRGRPQRAMDLSVVLLAVLYGLALPPTLPWEVNLVGVAVATALAKHAFGGLGGNLFNPAMAGYGFILLAYPVVTAQWPPSQLGVADPGLLAQVFAGERPDGWSGATPLDAVKTDIQLQQTIAEIRSAGAFGVLGGERWEWINLAFLGGGLWLLLRRRIRWQIPLGFLLGLFAAASVGYAVDADRFAPPLFHLLAGACMLGAFFIATDPVTSPSHARGRLVFGLGVGVMTYLVRTFGAYPDGVAFAVLTMNALTPMIERFLRPPVTGAASQAAQVE